jgi:hypothetical protein
MDISTIKALGAIRCPSSFLSPVLASSSRGLYQATHGDNSSEQAGGKGKTMAMNCFGLIVLLDERGRLHYANARSTNSSHEGSPDDIVSLVPVEGGQDALEQHSFTSLHFHENGYLLLLWSRNSVGIMEIPRAWNTTRDRSVACKFYCPLDVSSEEGRSLKGHTVVHADFYPHSASHVVVLYSSCLVIIDLVMFSVQRIPISVEHTFVSFCFGPPFDWLAFTVLLLESGGDVYALCPVLPRASRVSTELVDSLQRWATDRQRSSDDSNRSRRQRAAGSQLLSSYVQAVQQFLRSLGSDVADNKLSVGGGYDLNYCDMGIDESKSSSISFDSIPMLQGPFISNRARDRNGPRRAARATDIAIPSARSLQNSSPVVAIAFEDGAVELLVLAVEVKLSFHRML